MTRLELGLGPDQHRDRSERVVGEGPLVEQGRHGTAQAQRIERLDQPSFGTGAPGQEDVGPPVAYLAQQIDTDFTGKVLDVSGFGVSWCA